MKLLLILVLLLSGCAVVLEEEPNSTKSGKILFEENYGKLGLYRVNGHEYLVHSDGFILHAESCTNHQSLNGLQLYKGNLFTGNHETNAILVNDREWHSIKIPN